MAGASTCETHTCIYTDIDIYSHLWHFADF